MGPLGVKIVNEDWVLIEGSPEVLVDLANEILKVANQPKHTLTLDHPGPFTKPDSVFGLIVAREGGTW
jgi:hypothetical protein